MRVLHTADWHLGARIDQGEITEEHTRFLDWLITAIDEYKVDLLVIAGDIFDSGNPPGIALKQYYDFLWRVKGTLCHNVVIIGGNHDSISMLNAPRELLKYLHIYVVGGVPDNIEEQVIPIIKNGVTELIVCAVPFLRDKDVKLSVSGEMNDEREQRIKEGIANHYRMLLPYIAEYRQKGIPILATGHLFATGAKTSDSERDIHVGNLGQIGADEFPQEFDYVALGHLHRPQLVNNRQHIRYSGSPVALSFSEAGHNKEILLLNFDGGKLTAIETLQVPPSRRLYHIKGDLDKVKRALADIKDDNLPLPAWVEIEVETDTFLQNLAEELEAAKGAHIERLIIRQKRVSKAQNLDKQVAESLSLNDLGPETVFIKKCSPVFEGDEYNDLLQTFKEAIEKMHTEILIDAV